MAAAAKPCVTCGHNKGQHSGAGCTIDGCTCGEYASPAMTAPAATEWPATLPPLRTPPSAIDVVQRHRDVVAQHETLEDARKIHTLSVLDQVLTDLRG